ncbi:hypothetical protein DIPPA_16340 [Diplonema papillatum]|nr:hypothetical protein DIPPA_16340 [Diplonema papillatum]
MSHTVCPATKCSPCTTSTRMRFALKISGAMQYATAQGSCRGGAVKLNTCRYVFMKKVISSVTTTDSADPSSSAEIRESTSAATRADLRASTMRSQKRGTSIASATTAFFGRPIESQMSHTVCPATKCSPCTTSTRMRFALKISGAMQYATAQGSCRGGAVKLNTCRYVFMKKVISSVTTTDSADPSSSAEIRESTSAATRADLRASTMRSQKRGTSIASATTAFFGRPIESQMSHTVCPATKCSPCTTSTRMRFALKISGAMQYATAQGSCRGGAVKLNTCRYVFMKKVISSVTTTDSADPSSSAEIRESTSAATRADLRASTMRSQKRGTSIASATTAFFGRPIESQMSHTVCPATKCSPCTTSTRMRFALKISGAMQYATAQGSCRGGAVKLNTCRYVFMKKVISSVTTTDSADPSSSAEIRESTSAATRAVS